eukprot:TRINITY_DN452_c0_g1_i4.p1 TRINITY_DN452_c0_g1~~TRINITY_DN452_c0_g1_i4.p1  ORF type:complete len:301 (-),score=52.51 TRINITY_DN452_c0_g1_i4:33-935(-)
MKLKEQKNQLFQNPFKPAQRDPNRKKQIPLIGGPAPYVLTYSLLEVPLLQALTHKLYTTFIEPPHPHKPKKHAKVHDHALADYHTPKTFISLLAVKSLCYAFLASLSHPFSIIRTIGLATGSPPLDTFTGNFKYATSEGRYQRSITGHIIAGLSSIWVGDTLLFFAMKHFGTNVHVAMNMAWLHQLVNNSLVKLTAGFIAKTIIFPFDVIRTRLEVQGITEGEGPLVPRCDGFIDCAKTIAREEGWTGFYKGIFPHTMAFCAQLLWTGVMYLVARGIIKFELYDEDELFEGEEGYNPVMY